MDAREGWFLRWRMRQAAAFLLLGAAAAAHASGRPDPECAPRKPASSGAPSIVILIDHSASMRAADPGAGRYRAAARLLERVGGIAPEAEAAVIVFSDILHFDWRDDAFLQPAFPGNPGMQFESYVPFTRLGATFADGRTGLDTLKAFLRCGTSRPDHATTRRTGYLSDFPLALEAARAAFRRSGSAPSRRMLVVITDGEVPAASVFGRDSAWALFQRGLDLPATYVLHAHGDASADTPQGLRDLVANIAGNGHSAANPRSAVFPVRARDCGGAGSLEERILSDIANPVLESAIAAAASHAGCSEANAPAIRAGNPLARIRAGEPEGRGKPWLVAGPPASASGSGDWSCCRLLAGKPPAGDTDRYIHVALESDRPFVARAKVFSRLGESVAHADLRIDGEAFASLPASPGGRTLDLYWDGHADGGAPAATGAYVMTVKTSDVPGTGRPVRASASSAQRIGVLRTR